MASSTVTRFAPDLFKAARLRRKLSQAQVAHRVGVKRQAISQVESGRTRPSLRLLEAFSLHCAIDLRGLFVAASPRRG